jgi:hypothetical protein
VYVIIRAALMHLVVLFFAAQVACAAGVDREPWVIEGRVSSDGGVVAEAMVYVFPIPSGPFLSIGEPAAADGSFEITLPASAKAFDVMVVAPGFATAFRRLECPVPWTEVRLSQAAGTLQLAFSRSDEDAATHRWPLLVHGGVSRPLPFYLRHGWQFNGITSGLWRFTLYALEPGDYTLCDPAQCVTTIVAPLGIASLTLP